MTTPRPDDITIDRLWELREADITELADVLIDCVDGGASVSFMQPLSPDKAREFWRSQARDRQQTHRAGGA